MSVYVGNAIYIQHLVPKIQAIITRNPVIGQVFKDAGLEVIQPPNFNREKLRGTTIRKMILNGGNWEECVPKAVARIIRELNGVERLRRINTTD
jgi:nicotinamide-nucleotide adenylyltransferase